MINPLELLLFAPLWKTKALEVGFWIHDWHSHHLPIRCSKSQYTVNNSRKKLPFLNPFFNTGSSNPSSTSNAFWSHCHSLCLELNIMEYATQSSILNQKHVPTLFPLQYFQAVARPLTTFSPGQLCSATGWFSHFFHLFFFFNSTSTPKTCNEFSVTNVCLVLLCTNV